MKKEKNEKQPGKRNKIIIAILFIIILIIIAFCCFSNKKITLSVDNKEITFNYSTMNFKMKDENKTKRVLESNDTEISIDIKENQLDSFKILKDYSVMAYKGKSVEYNKIPSYYYYDENQSQYIVCSKIDEKKYIEIIIKSKQKSKDIINQEKIQKFLNSIKITK